MIIDGEVSLVSVIDGEPSIVTSIKGNPDLTAGHIDITDNAIPAFKYFRNTDIVSVAMDHEITVGESAFEGCVNLRYVRGPENDFGHITYIGARAFKGCAEITEATLTASYVGDYAFAETGIKTVHVASWNVVAGERIFGEVEEDFRIYINSEDLFYYQQAPGWSYYRDYMYDAG